MTTNYLNFKMRISLIAALVFFAFLGLFFFPQSIRAEGLTDTDQEITAENQATIVNEVNIDLNTGENQTNDNHEDGSINTGDANGSVDIVNNVGTNIVSENSSGINYEIANLTEPGGDVIINGSTPAGSGGILPIGEVLVGQSNYTQIDNLLVVNADTGQNTANENGGNGLVETGDINLAVNLVNISNLNAYLAAGGYLGIVNVFGDWDGNLYLTPEMTNGNMLILVPAVGDCDTCSQDDALYIYQVNNAASLNNIFITAETGLNEAVANGGDGTIETGAINLATNLINIGNINIVGGNIILFIVNVTGDWLGTNQIVSASGTQEPASNQSCDEGCDQNNSLTVAANNNLLSNNDIQMNLNTGGNTANYNHDDGQIKTGDINAIVNILNIYNLNIIADRVTFIIVNVFGDWTGDIATYSEEEGEDGQDGGSGSDGIHNGGNGVAVSSYSSSRSDVVLVAKTNGIVLAAAVSDDTELDDPLSGIKGDTESREATVQSCYWWWVVLLGLAILLFINWLLLKNLYDKRGWRITLMTSPAALGILAYFTHLWLQDDLTPTVYCRYLPLFIILLVLIFYLGSPNVWRRNQSQ